MSPIFLLLPLLLLLFTPTTTAVVLDSEDNPVTADSYYLGISIAFTQMGAEVGGGITMFNTGSVGCPSFIVAQSNISNRDLGIPIKFTPQSKINIVKTWSNINIAFKFLRPEPLCRRRYTTVWTVSGSDNGNKVVLDGEVGSNGSWFKLEKVDYLAGNIYYIFYGEKMVLYDQQPNGEILLNLEKGFPFIVGFLKIHETESTTTFDSLKMPRFPFAQELLAKKYSNMK